MPSQEKSYVPVKYCADTANHQDHQDAVKCLNDSTNNRRFKGLEPCVKKQFKIALCLNLNCLCFGLGLSWPSPMIVKLTDANQTVLSRPLEAVETSWIVSLPYLTGALGYFTSICLVDSIGRKHCTLLCSVSKLMSALLFLFTTDVWMLVLGRIIEGFSEGIILGVIPVYSSELASKEIRGALGTMLQIFSSLGVVVMLCVGPFVSYFYMNLLYVIIIVVASVPTIFMPDSPYFLYSKGKHDETRKVLIFLRGSEASANEELKEYSINNNEAPSLIATFRNKMFLKSLGTCFFILISVYLTCYNSVSSYLQTILIATDTDVKAEVASAVIGGIQMVASLSTMMTTDRFGRKPILVTSLLGMFIGMVCLGAFFKLKELEVEVSGILNYLPLISLMIVVFCYSAGCGSLIWVLLAELFDDRFRGVGFPFNMLIGVMPSFLVVRYFTAVTTSIGTAATFWCCSGFCVILAAFIMFRVPETKGKTFAEIQDALGRPNKS